MLCQRGAQFYVMPPSLYRQGKTFAALEYEVSYFSFKLIGDRVCCALDVCQTKTSGNKS